MLSVVTFLHGYCHRRPWIIHTVVWLRSPAFDGLRSSCHRRCSSGHESGLVGCQGLSMRCTNLSASARTASALPPMNLLRGRCHHHGDVKCYGNWHVSVKERRTKNRGSPDGQWVRSVSYPGKPAIYPPPLHGRRSRERRLRGYDRPGTLFLRCTNRPNVGNCARSRNERSIELILRCHKLVPLTCILPMYLGPPHRI